MKNLRAGITAAAATAVLGLGGVAVAATASASSPHTTTSATPCATQQAQLTRAEHKLDSLKLKLAAVVVKIKQDKASSTAQAKNALARDKAKRAGLLKDKKAQVQRVKHAQARLDKCLAAHPSSTASATSSASA
jgi:hypothetical protein